MQPPRTEVASRNNTLPSDFAVFTITKYIRIAKSSGTNDVRASDLSIEKIADTSTTKPKISIGISNGVFLSLISPSVIIRMPKKIRVLSAIIPRSICLGRPNVSVVNEEKTIGKNMNKIPSNIKDRFSKNFDEEFFDSVIFVFVCSTIPS